MSDTKYVIDRDTLVDVGNAIRTKKGTSAQIPVTNLASEISSIPSGIPGYRIATGSFILAEDRLVMWSRRSVDTEPPGHNPYPIAHGLGVVPHHFRLWCSNDASKDTNTLVKANMDVGPATNSPYYSDFDSWVTKSNGSSNNASVGGTQYNTGASSDLTQSTRDRHSVSMDDTYAYIGDRDGASTASQDFVLKANITYYWMAIYDENWKERPLMYSYNSES